MDDWAADPEEPLHICLGRWATVHQRVGMDEGKVLALPCGEAGCESSGIKFLSLFFDVGGQP